MAGFRDGMTYGYSNARVKAMESRLIGGEMFERMLAAKEKESIVGMLLQTSYKDYIEEFGGVAAMDTLIDFALSKSLGDETNKLVLVAPKHQKNLILPLVGIWDVHNIKLILGAVETKKGFDQISRYLISSRYIDSEEAKEIVTSEDVEGAINRLMGSTPYSDVLAVALETYKKSKSMVEVNSQIERAYYAKLSSTITKLTEIDRNAATLVRKNIDMRNIITLLKGKKYGLSFAALSGLLIQNGSVGISRLERIYESSKSLEALIDNTDVFDLRKALEQYNASKNKALVIFEIAMRSNIFIDALRTVRHSVLSFGSIIGFFYLKEIEVFTIRILVKGKAYMLSDDEIRSMITWLK